MGKLIFLDIDGTLVPAGTNAPPKSAERAIRLAQERGHRVFLCSGRNLGMLRPLLRYRFDGYVASSGGYVVLGEELLFDHPMSVARSRSLSSGRMVMWCMDGLFIRVIYQHFICLGAFAGEVF